jgi:hypothetical protein
MTHVYGQAQAHYEYREWPPYALTASTTTVNGDKGYGGGTYTLTASRSVLSSVSGGPQGIFDKLTAATGHFVDGNYNTDGTFNKKGNSAYTFAEDPLISGDWFELAFPVNVAFASFTIVLRDDSNFRARGPKFFKLYGKRVTGTWTVLADFTSKGMSYDSGTNNVEGSFSLGQQFDYAGFTTLRMVVSAIWSNQYSTVLNFAELKIVARVSLPNQLMKFSAHEMNCGLCGLCGMR